MADIFLSYARQDEARAATLAHALGDLGWTVFWDRRIRAGSSWDEVIERELRACKCVVVLWSAASVSSRWVKTEARYGLQRNVLVPACLDSTELPIEFGFVESAQLHAWTGSRDDSEFLILLDGITQHVKPTQRELASSDVAKPLATETAKEPSASTTLPRASLPARQPPDVEKQPAPPRPSRWRNAWLPIACAAAVVIVIAGIVALKNDSPPPAKNGRSDDVAKQQPATSSETTQSKPRSEGGAPSATREAVPSGTPSPPPGTLSRSNEITDLGGSTPLTREAPRSVAITDLGGTELDGSDRPTEIAPTTKFGAPVKFRSDFWNFPDEPLLGFVEIPEGVFTMGSDAKIDPEAYRDEFPQHKVSLPSYFIGRYEVTVKQYRACVDDHGCTLKDPRGLKVGDDFPVLWVSWHEAVAYCDWLNQKLTTSSRTPKPIADVLAGRRDGQRYAIRLPSEPEWEKAARGRDGRTYPWGEAIHPERANYNPGVGLNNARPVGSFPRGASPYFVLDMIGNASEWTRSLPKPYPYIPADGREDLRATGKRVLRGGSFDDAVSGADRSAARDSDEPDAHQSTYGFRIALSPR